jgi:hypothetical protein
MEIRRSGGGVDRFSSLIAIYKCYSVGKSKFNSRVSCWLLPPFLFKRLKTGFITTKIEKDWRRKTSFSKTDNAALNYGRPSNGESKHFKKLL